MSDATQLACCRCSVASAELPPTEHAQFVGDIARASGYRPLFRNDGGIMWLCPECRAKLRALLGPVVAFIGKDVSDAVNWDGVVACLDKGDI
jgi:hypothetical protein